MVGPYCVYRQYFMRTIQQFYRVDRRGISLIKFIFEAYEGLAVVTTLDPVSGLITLRIAPGCEAMAADIMMDLGKSFLIEPVQENPAIPAKE